MGIFNKQGPDDPLSLILFIFIQILRRRRIKFCLFSIRYVTCRILFIVTTTYLGIIKLLSLCLFSKSIHGRLKITNRILLKEVEQCGVKHFSSY